MLVTVALLRPNVCLGLCEASVHTGWEPIVSRSCAEQGKPGQSRLSSWAGKQMQVLALEMFHLRAHLTRACRSGSGAHFGLPASECVSPVIHRGLTFVALGKSHRRDCRSQEKGGGPKTGLTETSP